jgi:glycosyltransferase involved in cell wall biosynthesis
LPDEQNKPRVLVSGHLPPPMGGMSMFYLSLLGSSLPQRVELSFVQTSTRDRALAASGQISLRNLALAVKDWARFTVAVIKHRPQLAHIATAFGMSFTKHSVCVALARLLGCRVLLHPHCGFATLYADRPGWWRRLFRWIINLTDGIISLSSEWEQLRAEIPACPVYYLPNAINLKPFEGVAAARLARPIDPTPLRVLYLGYVGQAKGSLDLVEAAAQLQADNADLRFELVGDDLTPGERGAVQTRIDRLGLRQTVTLRPPVYGADKTAVFSNADIFVYPSYHEGMPLAVLEAMACGLPVVASRVGGLPDLVHNGVNGLLVEPGQPAQLVAALRQLANDHRLRRQMQRQSYRLAVENYDLEQRVVQLVEIYKTTLRSRRAGAAPVWMPDKDLRA